VDRSFVDGLGKQPQDAAIMKAIVEMCHALDLADVAEGVETDAQRDAVRSLGCELVQGYLLCRPMPSEEITEFLDERLRPRDLHGALTEISSHDGLHVHRNRRRPPGGAPIDAS
jgi:EAL domain-containing protein (putative c-di-GMP-specific phosphodiesterase class I)